MNDFVIEVACKNFNKHCQKISQFILTGAAMKISMLSTTAALKNDCCNVAKMYNTCAKTEHCCHWKGSER
jgi:hypothetical protein